MWSLSMLGFKCTILVKGAPDVVRCWCYSFCNWPQGQLTSWCVAIGGQRSTYCGWDKMATIVQTTFWNASSGIPVVYNFEFQIKFYRWMFLRVWLTFKSVLVQVIAGCHYLDQCLPRCMMSHIASLGHNELNCHAQQLGHLSIERPVFKL